MAIYKRGKTYWYDFWFHGKRYQESTKTKNLRAAEMIQAKAKTDLALGCYGLTPIKAGPRFSKFAEQFKEHVQIRNGNRPATVAFYLEKLKRLLEFRPLADCGVNLIDEPLIEQYIQHRLKQVRQVATVNRDLATLRRALYAAKDTFKLIREVPRITFLRGEREREFVLSQDQEKAYLALAHDTLRDFAILSLDTGVRSGEGVALEWSSVHLEPAQGGRLGYVAIRKGKTKNAKRRLSITPRVKAMLERRRAFFPDAQFVFPSRYDEEKHMLRSSLDHMHARARTAALGEDGEPIFPAEFVVHSLRHTFATRLGESGADAFTIMRVMGHSSVTISQKYVHPTPAWMERAFENLNAMNEQLKGERSPV